MEPGSREYGELQASVHNLQFIVPDLALSPGGGLEPNSKKLAGEMQLPQFCDILCSVQSSGNAR